MRQHQRSYGYIAPSQSNPNNNHNEPSRRGKKPPTSWLKYLFIPIILVYRLILGVFKGIFTIFKIIFKRKSSSRNSKDRKQKNKKIRKNVLKLAIISTLIIIAAGSAVVAWASRDLPDPNKLTDRIVAQSTKIYDRTGEHLLYEIFADEKRTLVELEDIPEDLVNGVIATEDTSFYEHFGIRPLSIVRSVVNGVLGRGRLGGGASTLTQQLVKNAILSSERTVTRKLKEIILALRLEQKYDKQQILKIYFNEIPYGSTNYGVQSAAQSYFGKDVTDLSLAESATLAGLPKAPTRYLGNPEALKERRNFVLRRMFEEGYISEDQKIAAQAEPLSITTDYGELRAAHFSIYVRKQLVEEFGEKMVGTGGLKVITSLDWDLQQEAERIISEEAPAILAEAGANNVSLVSMDPRTGHILAMIGSQDFNNKEIDGQYNVATLAERQPGSSFKPIIYAAAFEKGYTAETILFDVVTNFAASGRSYEPRNYDLQEHGPVTIRKALQGSLNIPAVKTMYLVGQKKALEFAARLGYTTLQDGEFGLSLVLGGGEVRLLDHVGAYAVFANNGVKQTATSILRVEDPEGKVIKEWKSEKGDSIVDEKVTSLLSNVLSDDNARAYAFGRGSVLTIPGHQVAAKTGTTNNYKDAWTIGYTPEIVTGVWAGNSDNTDMKRGYGGSKVAGPIWNKFMRAALADKTPTSFPAPPANTSNKPILTGANEGSVTLKVDKVTNLLASSSTPEKFIVERTYLLPHSVLHYLQKDNPLGPAPENPASDPQYNLWENAIQGWIARRKEENPDWDVAFEDPPTEFDDVHSLDLIPSIEVIFPLANTTLTSRQIDTDIRVTAQRGVSKVSYKIDGRYVGVVDIHPFNLNYYAKDVEPGVHTLTIIVEDDVGNRIEEDIPFELQVAAELASANWSNPPQTVKTNDFPQLLFLQLFKVEEIESITINAKKKGNGNEEFELTTITDFSSLFGDLLTLTWQDPPEKGEWTLRILVDRKDGSSEITNETTIKAK